MVDNESYVSISSHDEHMDHQHQQQDDGPAADDHYHQYPPHHQAEIHYQHNKLEEQHRAVAEPVAVI